MSTVEPVASRFEKILGQLRERGDVELANEVALIAREVASMQGRGRDAGAQPTASESALPVALEPGSDLMTADEAARALGIRSLNTVERWARERLLEGSLRGGHMMISRKSVDSMLASPALARQREYERNLAEVLDAVDAGDDPLPPMDMAHRGRKPWDAVAPPRR